MTLRDRSRKDYSAVKGTFEELNAGSLQRIADACELMAESHSSLIRDRDMYKRWYEDKQAECKRLAASNNSLNGAVTKAKRRTAMEHAEGQR